MMKVKRRMSRTAILTNIAIAAPMGVPTPHLPKSAQPHSSGLPFLFSSSSSTTSPVPQPQTMSLLWSPYPQTRLNRAKTGWIRLQSAHLQMLPLLPITNKQELSKPLKQPKASQSPQGHRAKKETPSPAVWQLALRFTIPPRPPDQDCPPQCYSLAS